MQTRAWSPFCTGVEVEKDAVDSLRFVEGDINGGELLRSGLQLPRSATFGRRIVSISVPLRLISGSKDRTENFHSFHYTDKTG
jgi:hypothetical protein